MSSDGHLHHDVYASDSLTGGTKRGPPSAWSVELQGGDLELKALDLLFRTPQLHVKWVREGTALLTSSEFAPMADPQAVWKRAQTLVTRLKATGILKFGHFQPVSGKRVVRQDEEGQEQGYAQHWHTVALPSRTLEAFVAYTPNRPTVEGDPANDGAPDRFPKVEEWIVGSDDKAIDTVCSLLVEHSDDWRVLAFIYEVVEGQVGQASRMQKLGWATVTEIKLFIDTANSPEAIGTAARHGHHRRPAPAKPMALREAQELIGRIVAAWLEWKRTGK